MKSEELMDIERRLHALEYRLAMKKLEELERRIDAQEKARQKPKPQS